MILFLMIRFLGYASLVFGMETQDDELFPLTLVNKSDEKLYIVLTNNGDQDVEKRFLEEFSDPSKRNLENFQKYNVLNEGEIIELEPGAEKGFKFVNNPYRSDSVWGPTAYIYRNQRDCNIVCCSAFFVDREWLAWWGNGYQYRLFIEDNKLKSSLLKG